MSGASLIASGASLLLLLLLLLLLPCMLTGVELCMAGSCGRNAAISSATT